MGHGSSRAAEPSPGSGLQICCETRELRGARCAQSLQHTGTPASIYKHGTALPRARLPPTLFPVLLDSDIQTTPDTFRRFLSLDFIRLNLFTQHTHTPSINNMPPKKTSAAGAAAAPKAAKAAPSHGTYQVSTLGFCNVEHLSNAKQAMITDAIVAVLIPVPFSPAHEVSSSRPVSVSP